MIPIHHIRHTKNIWKGDYMIHVEKTKLKKLAKVKKFERNLKQKNMQRRDSNSNPRPAKTNHFGNIGLNSAGEPVSVSDSLPNATVHLDWPLRACSLPLTSFQVGFGFWDLAYNSLGQAVGTLKIAGQHHPSDKYTYQLSARACALVLRLSVSSRLSCLKRCAMHARSRSSASSTVYFQGKFIPIIWIVHIATFGQVVVHVSMFCIVA